MPACTKPVRFAQLFATFPLNQLQVRNLLLLVISLCIIGCGSPERKKQTSSLKSWIFENQQQINSTCDSVIADFHKREKPDSNWTSSTISITEYAPNILGAFAAKAGDSTECIILSLSFYKDQNRKKDIIISAYDSSCLTKLRSIVLQNDSTDNFTFSVNENPPEY
jgi:hypothetical protein